MKKRLQVGLVAEGSSTESKILHLPKLAEELGPVKSTVLRVSRRLSNTLRAGYAVTDYEELQAASLILLRVPDASVPRVVDELCSSDLALKDLSFVLCESWLPLYALSPLAAKGASIATLVHLPVSRRNWFIVEGHAKAVRQIRQFLDRNDARSNEIVQGSKHLLFVSEILATALPVPFLVVAQQSLRAAGISGRLLLELMEEITEKMLQDFQKGARGYWGGPLTECSEETALLYLERLHQSHPAISSFLNYHLPSARQTMLSHRPSQEELESFVQTTEQ